MVADLQDAIEGMRCAIVVPRRSVERVRRALAEGRDPEPYLDDILTGLESATAIADRVEGEACSHCHGTGREVTTNAPVGRDPVGERSSKPKPPSTPTQEVSP